MSSPTPFHSVSLGREIFQDRCFPAGFLGALEHRYQEREGVSCSCPVTPVQGTTLSAVVTIAGKCHRGMKLMFPTISPKLTDSETSFKSPSVYTLWNISDGKLATDTLWKYDHAVGRDWEAPLQNLTKSNYQSLLFRRKSGEKVVTWVGWMGQCKEIFFFNCNCLKTGI